MLKGYFVSLFAFLCCITLCVRAAVTFTYDENTYTLTFSGDGPMDDYEDVQDAPWFAYQNDVANLVFENGVTYVGKHNFYQFSNVSSITFAKSVTVIGYGSFCECTKLASVEFHEDIMRIDNSAFRACTSLEYVFIPSKVETIGSTAFAGCSKLTAIDVDPENTHYVSVDGVLFNPDRSKLLQFPGGKTGHYDVPANITAIEFGVFEGCSLTSVNMLGNVSYIVSSAFLFCRNLESVVLSDSITSIGYMAFYGCTSLKSINLPASLTKLDDYAFLGCSQLSFVTYNGPSTTNFDCNGDSTFCGCPIDYFCVPLDSNLTSFCQGTTFARAESCESLKEFTEDEHNECYHVENINGEWTIVKNEEAKEWENKTNNCVMYQCINDTGITAQSQCTGDDVMCVDGKCESTKTIDNKWAVTIEINQTIEVNISETIEAISLLTGIGSDEITVAFEYNEEGYIISVVILVDDEDTARKIENDVNDLYKGETCKHGEYGILCDSNGVHVTDLAIGSSVITSSSHNTSNHCYPLLMMVVLFTFFFMMV